jgi:hypothetical protein
MDLIKVAKRAEIFLETNSESTKKDGLFGSFSSSFGRIFLRVTLRLGPLRVRHAKSVTHFGRVTRRP